MADGKWSMEEKAKEDSLKTIKGKETTSEKGDNQPKVVLKEEEAILSIISCRLLSM